MPLVPNSFCRSVIGELPTVTTMPWSTAALTRSWKAVPPGWPMISMQLGLAATASLNWLIMVSGAQAENCALRSTPNAAAACAAPVWRASVAPSPALPPICMYMVRPLPIGSSASAVPAIIAAAAAPASRICVSLMFLSLFVDAPPQASWPERRRSFGRTHPAETLCPSEPREERAPPLRFLRIEIEDDRHQEDQAAHRVDPGAGQAGRDQARLDHGDDEAAEDCADDGRAPAEDRGAADQHRGDGDEQVALALVAEIVLVLKREEDGGDRRQPAHQGEELDLLAVDRSE